MIRPVMHACRYIPFAGVIPGGILLADHLIKDRQHSIHLLAKAYLYDQKPKHPVRDGLLYITPFVNTLFGLCKLIIEVAKRIFPEKAPDVPLPTSPPAPPPLPSVEPPAPLVEPSSPKPLSAEDIENAKENVSSAQDAVAIAHYYLGEKNEELAIKWLCKGKTYTNDPLPIDLADFFSHITAIRTSDLFAHRELYRAAASSPAISELKLVNISWDHDLIFCVADFLRETKAVTSLHIENTSPLIKHISTYAFSPFIAALTKNQSIKQLTLIESDIYDASVKELLEAIENNPFLQLDLVRLTCFMKSSSAEKLLGLLQKGKIKKATAKIEESKNTYKLIDQLAKYAPTPVEP